MKVSIKFKYVSKGEGPTVFPDITKVCFYDDIILMVEGEYGKELKFRIEDISKLIIDEHEE